MNKNSIMFYPLFTLFLPLSFLLPPSFTPILSLIIHRPHLSSLLPFSFSCLFFSIYLSIFILLYPSPSLYKIPSQSLSKSLSHLPLFLPLPLPLSHPSTSPLPPCHSFFYNPPLLSPHTHTFPFPLCSLLSTNSPSLKPYDSQVSHNL